MTSIDLPAAIWHREDQGSESPEIASDAELELIVSDYVYRNLVCHHPRLVSPDAFGPARFQVKYQGDPVTELRGMCRTCSGRRSGSRS